MPQLLLLAGAAGPPRLPPGARARRGQTIGVSQPRRVAAVTVSRRVAEEMGTAVGGASGAVGYSVRFDTRSGPRTRVRFATDGMLLREAQADPLLGRYGVLVVDEAHERSVSTDVLLGVVRRAMERRALPGSRLPPLRVVVMSATLDAARFAAFFGGGEGGAPCPVVTVPGRQHPVSVAYVTAPSENVVDDAVATVLQAHLADVGWPAGAATAEEAEAAGMAPGDVRLGDAALARGGYLVFLPGAEEIEDACSALRQRGDALPAPLPRLHVCPLYAALPPEAQMRAFDLPPPGTRKVVVATNIAETSVTVPGVATVIDSGIVKVRGFAAASGVQTLRAAPVAQAQARQRAGRAGREGPGRCLRLFPESDWASLSAQPTAEIHRASLDSVVLRLVAMGVPPSELQSFPLIEPPPPASLAASLTRLLQLRAVDAATGALTARGRAMASLPVEPAAASLLLAAREAGCVGDMCTVVSLADADGLLQTPRDKEAKAMRARRGFSAWEGDHVMLVRVWEAFGRVVAAAGGAAGPGGTVRFDDEADEGGFAREEEEEQEEEGAGGEAGAKRRAKGKAARPRRRRPLTAGMGKRAASDVLEWCRRRFVSLRALRRADAVRCQLLDALDAAVAEAGGDGAIVGAVSASSSAGASLRATAAATPSSVGLPDGSSDAEVRSAALRRALVAGFPSQLAQRMPAQASGRPEYRIAGTGMTAGLHPSSCLHEHAHAAADRARSSARRGRAASDGAGPGSLWEAYPEWVCFGELVSTSRPYLRSVSRVDADWLPELAPELFHLDR